MDSGAVTGAAYGSTNNYYYNCNYNVYSLLKVERSLQKGQKKGVDHNISITTMTLYNIIHCSSRKSL